MAERCAFCMLRTTLLSENRLAERGSINEIVWNDGYRSFWSGKLLEARRASRGGFAIRTNIANKLVDFPIAHSDRLMSLRLPLDKKRYLTIVSVYASTLTSDNASKECFYDQLHQLLVEIPSQDKLILMGDFNARVRRDYAS